MLMHPVFTCFVFASYMSAALGVARLNAVFWKERPRASGLIVLDLLFLPAYLLGLLLLCCVLTPYWWLYPERHLHALDVEGPEEQMKAWADYKVLVRRKPVWRRLVEKMKFAQPTGPQWPIGL